MMTYWTRIDHGTAVGVRNGRGRSLHRPSDVSLRRLSRCLRSLAERCAKHSPRTPASACAWSKSGSRISARRWRSCSGKPKRSLGPIKSRKRSEGQKVRIVIIVSYLFHSIRPEFCQEFSRYFLMCAWPLLNPESWNSFLIPCNFENIVSSTHYFSSHIGPDEFREIFTIFALFYSSYLLFPNYHVV